MKVTKPLIVAAFILAVGLFQPSALARVDFTNLSGTYTATYHLTTDTGTDFTGAVTVLARQLANGNKVQLSIFGYFGTTSTPPPTTAMVGIITLNSHHTILADNVFLALSTKIPASRTTFTGDHSPLGFTLTNSSGGGVTMTYTMRFNRTRLSITGTGTSGATNISISLIGTKSTP